MLDKYAVQDTCPMGQDDITFNSFIPGGHLSINEAMVAVAVGERETLWLWLEKNLSVF